MQRTLLALDHLLYGHIEAQEWILFDQIVIILNHTSKTARQTLPLDLSMLHKVLQFDLNVLARIVQVSDHEMRIIDLLSFTIKNCEVHGALG